MHFFQSGEKLQVNGEENFRIETNLGALPSFIENNRRTTTVGKRKKRGREQQTEETLCLCTRHCRMQVKRHGLERQSLVKTQPNRCVCQKHQYREEADASGQGSAGTSSFPVPGLPSATTGVPRPCR